MIIAFLVTTLLAFAKLVLGVLPTVPATPQPVVDGGNWVIQQITAVISVLQLVYTSTLLNAIIVAVIAMFTFEWIYHSVMWIVRKIPIINIK